MQYVKQGRHSLARPSYVKACFCNICSFYFAVFRILGIFIPQCGKDKRQCSHKSDVLFYYWNVSCLREPRNSLTQIFRYSDMLLATFLYTSTLPHHHPFIPGKYFFLHCYDMISQDIFLTSLGEHFLTLWILWSILKRQMIKRYLQTQVCYLLGWIMLYSQNQVILETTSIFIQK